MGLHREEGLPVYLPVSQSATASLWNFMFRTQMSSLQAAEIICSHPLARLR